MHALLAVALVSTVKKGKARAGRGVGGWVGGCSAGRGGEEGDIVDYTLNPEP
jgi:hypothetical protein